MAEETSEKTLFDPSNDQILNDEILLASQVKQFEAVTDEKLDPTRPYVVRLDGVSFRTYTRGFAKPFDQRMTRAFIRTCADLLERFNPLTIFYESDEISLVFDACKPIESTDKHLREHMYSGRIQKIVSVLASFTAAKFNKYINEEDWSNVDKLHVRQRVQAHSAYFDGRAFSLPNQFAAMASVFWRHRYDTLKNSTLTYARSYYTQSEMQNKSPHVLRDLMLREHNWNLFDEAPKNIIYGTFLKKELYDLEAIDQKTKESVIVKRSRVRIGSFNMHQILPTNQDKIQFMLSKYWNDSNSSVNNLEIPEWWMKYYLKQQEETVTDD